jgi:hypothetical protein
VAAVVAAVALLPGVGFGEAQVYEGSSPTRVYTVEDPGLCPLDKIGYPGQQFRVMNIQVDQPSQVVAYWTMKWSTGRTQVEGELGAHIEINGVDGYYDRSPGDGFTWNLGDGHQTATVMWPFQNVQAGEYDVQVGAIVVPAAGRLQQNQGVTLQGCTMTVFVIPAVISPPTPSATQSPPSPSPPPSPPSVA